MLLHSTLAVTCVLLASFPCLVQCLTCLKCDSVIKPRLCTEIEQCGPHEVCTTETYVTPNGAIRYRVGCKDKLFCVSTDSTDIGKRHIHHDSVVSERSKDRVKKDTLVCSECCDESLCNSGGCGTQGFDVSLGPVCYSCSSQIGADGCNHIQQCGRDKMCMIISLTLPGETDAYRTSCEHQDGCNAIRIPSSSGDGSYSCSACCNQSLCNSFPSGRDVCNFQSSTVTPTALLSSSRSSTVTPSALLSSSRSPTVTPTALPSFSRSSTVTPTALPSSSRSSTVTPSALLSSSRSPTAKPVTTTITSKQTTTTRITTAEYSTTTMLPSSSTTYVTSSTKAVSTGSIDCDYCLHFDPDLVCPRMTDYLQKCIQICGFKCPIKS